MNDFKITHIQNFFDKFRNVSILERADKKNEPKR